MSECSMGGLCCRATPCIYARPDESEELATLRARVDALERACRAVVNVSKSGADTVAFLVELHRVSRLCATALEPSP